MLPRLAAAASALVLLCAACAGGPKPRSEAAEGEVDLPAWLGVEGVVRDASLEEAAALLCARDTDSVVDDDVRHAAGIVDARVTGLHRVASSTRGTRAALSRDAPALLRALRATHAGVIEGRAPSGAPCAAVVASRRLLHVEEPLPSFLEAAAPFPLKASLATAGAAQARAFLLSPDGSVARSDVVVDEGRLRDQVAPRRGPGSYVLEVLLDRGDGDPEIALLWPFVVGAAKKPPAPEVLFPDEGHPDRALTLRAEALVERLRNEQLLEPLKLWPVLTRIAEERAASLAGQGALGHRVPGGVNALEALAAAAPEAEITRVAEVQASASTLAEAWTALLESPAHRYELVEPTITHMGASVVRGQDGAGRRTVTLVVLLARKPVQRDPRVAKDTILQGIDDARSSRGLDPLHRNRRLESLAARLAENMAGRGVLDEAGLGEPVARMALQDDASLVEVRPLLARLDDPLNVELPEHALDIDTQSVGLAIRKSDKDHLWYVVVLLGTGGAGP